MIKMVEDPESRDLHYGAQGGGQTLLFNAFTTAGETEQQVWLYALTQSAPFYNGFIRNDIKVTRNKSPNLFKVAVEYGTTGVGGGDQPLGGTGNDGGPPNTPTGPAETTTPLTSGWSFSIQAPQLHLLQSRQTLLAVKRGGGVAPNFKGRIGVDRDGKTVGCEVPPSASFVLKRTTARAVVTMGYLEVLTGLAGRFNNAPFWKRAAGEVLFLAADGQYTQGEGWSINWQFGIQDNENNIEICDGLPTAPDVISKRGWDYLWVLEEEIPDPVTGKPITVPAAAYVEEVIRPADFSLLEIGT